MERKPKVTEKRMKQIIEYNKTNRKRIPLDFGINETEILEKLASVPNKTDYIRQLILADIQKEKEANK